MRIGLIYGLSPTGSPRVSEISQGLPAPVSQAREVLRAVANVSQTTFGSPQDIQAVPVRGSFAFEFRSDRLRSDELSQRLHPHALLLRRHAESMIADQLRPWIDIRSDQTDFGPYQSLITHADKEYLRIFFQKIKQLRPVDYVTNPEKFKKRIQKILTNACKSAEATNLFFIRLPLITATCADGMLHELDNLELALDVLNAGNLDYKPLAELLLKRHRLGRLEEYVTIFLKQRQYLRDIGEFLHQRNDFSRDIATFFRDMAAFLHQRPQNRNEFSEDLEVSLFFRLRLKDYLPISTEDGQFLRCAEISDSKAPDLIDQALNFITEGCRTPEEQAQVLCRLEPWIDKVEQDRHFKLVAEALDVELDAELQTLEQEIEENKINSIQYKEACDKLMKRKTEYIIGMTEELLKNIQMAPEPVEGPTSQ